MREGGEGAGRFLALEEEEGGEAASGKRAEEGEGEVAGEGVKEGTAAQGDRSMRMRTRRVMEEEAEGACRGKEAGKTTRGNGGEKGEETKLQ